MEKSKRLSVIILAYVNYSQTFYFTHSVSSDLPFFFSFLFFFFCIFLCTLVLPELKAVPRVVDGSITATSVVLEWDAWNPDGLDSGDGPIVAYNVYDTRSMTLIQTEVVTPDVIPPISRLIQNLSPSTLYNFEVRPVREGLGGEGTATRFVVVFTASLTAEPQPQPQVTTSSVTAKTQVAGDTQRPGPGVGTNMNTVPQIMTTATSRGICQF